MTLTRDSLALVFSFLSPEDLLHCSRVCKPWRQCVQSDDAEPVWKALCLEHRYPYHPGHGPARFQFKQRHEQVLRDRRLKRRVELMTVRSAIATLQRELQQLQAQKKAEAQANRRARGEAASAAHLAQAQAAMQGWQLGVVQAHHERLMQPKPIEADWRLRNLDQSIKESDVHLRTLDKTIRAKQNALTDQQRRLAAMSGS